MRTSTWGLMPLVGVASCIASCASSPAGRAGRGPVAPAGAAGAAAGVHVAAASAPAVPLAGHRCQGGRCACRPEGANEPESQPPAEGMKRFEIRLGAAGGSASLETPALGTFAAGQGEVCFYVDVVAGTTHEVTFAARASRPEDGVAPRLKIAEYGPRGPWWYDVVEVACPGATGRCDEEGAKDWAKAARARRRGRIDPCGSAVVSKLEWETTGGQGSRDGGLFRDLSVTFRLEVKKFATQFAPGATECIPK